jgi:hypothetical protein
VATPAHGGPRSMGQRQLIGAWPHDCFRALGQRPRGRGGKTEHRGPDGPLTGGRAAVRRPDDGGKVAAWRKLGGGGARARRGEEESEDGHDED